MHRNISTALLAACILALACTAACGQSTVRLVFLQNGSPYQVLRAVSGPATPETAALLLVQGPSPGEAAMGITTAIPSGWTADLVGIDGDYAVISLGGIPAGAHYGDVTIDDIITQFMWTMRQFGLDARLLVGNEPISVLRVSIPPQPARVGVAAPQPVGAGNLSGKKICIRAGHGYKWNGSTWTTDRPVYCAPLSCEDFHNVDHAILLKYFLEQEGATVIDTREMNKSRGNSPYSSLPWWQLCSGPYCYDKGYPASVYAPYTGVVPGTPGVDQSEESRRISPEVSDYDGADMYISLHTNGFTGNCYGAGCPTGIECYWDSTKENGNQAQAYDLAYKVENNCAWGVQTYFMPSFPCRNSCTPRDTAFTEIHYPDAPACLLEFGFHDSCDLDGAYLRDPLFTSAGMYGVYKGICQFFGTTPSYDGYSAQYVSDTIPATIIGGRTVSASVTFGNRGVAWSESHAFRLGAVGDSDPFAATRHTISGTVAPGGTYTFTFNMTAPRTTGDYTTDWRMVRDPATWFGDTLTKVVGVDPPTDNDPPSVPGNLTATTSGTTSIDLAWEASTDNEVVTGYNIYRGGVKIKFVDAPATTYRDTGLVPGTPYSYQVSAMDASSNESGLSNTANATTLLDATPPAAPTNVTATGTTNSRIDLSWTASWDNLTVTKYKVFRDGGLVGEPTTTSYADTGLASGSSHSYQISAVDQSNNESNKSAPVSARTIDLGNVVLWSDDMESYTSQAEFNVGWPIYTGTGLTWSATQSFSPTHSAEETNVGMRNWHDFPSGISQISVGTFFEFKFRDPAAATNVRHYSEIRSYSGGGHSGTLQQMLVIGAYNTLTTSKYHGRVYAGGTDWFNLSNNRSSGWHTMRIDVTADTGNPITPGKGLGRWSVDGVTGAENITFTWQPLTCAVLGSGLGSSTAGNYYYDDFRYGVQGAVQRIGGPNVVESPCGTVTISWATDVNSDSRVDYGPTPAYGQSSSSGTLTKTHSIVLTGLATASTYHFKVTSAASGKTSSVSDDYTLNTNATSLVELKGLANGRSSGVCGVVVSSVLANGFYVQDIGRICGMKVLGTQSASVGSLIDVTGDLTTPGGERVLANAIVKPAGSGNAPDPLAMNNKAVGGGGIGLNIPGLTGGVGTNNIGLLIKVWGRVTEVGTNEFWVDDGSALAAAGGKTGIKVAAAGLILPGGDDYVVVTGISGAELSGGVIYPVIRPRTDADIVPILQ